MASGPKRSKLGAVNFDIARLAEDRICFDRLNLRELLTLHGGVAEPKSEACCFRQVAKAARAQLKPGLLAPWPSIRGSR
jgi:hypothetical protein